MQMQQPITAPANKCGFDDLQVKASANWTRFVELTCHCFYVAASTDLLCPYSFAIAWMNLDEPLLFKMFAAAVVAKFNMFGYTQYIQHYGRCRVRYHSSNGNLFASV